MILNNKKYLTIFIFFQAVIMISLIRFQHVSAVTAVWSVNIFYFFLLFDYICFLAVFIRFYEKREGLNINNWHLAAVAGFVGMFVILFLGMEDTIKQYDATVYWIKSMNVSDKMYADLLSGLCDIKQNLSAEYGNLPVLLFAPFIHYFGRNNIAFCSLTYIIYGIPAFALLTLYMVRVIKKCELTNRCTNILVYAGFLCPALLLPILSGYVDIIGIVWIGIMLNLSLDWGYTRLTVGKDMAFVTVSVLLLFSRRWYAFYIVGFYFSFALEEAVIQITEKKIIWQRIRNLMINLALIAGVSCLLIFMLNREVFQVFFGGNYSEAYAAYKIRSTYMDFIEGIRNLGGIFFVFAVIGALRLCSHRETLKYMMKTVVPPAAACILFGTVQSMGIHHMYLLIPHLVILEGVGISTVLGYVKNERFICRVLTAVLVMHVLVCFSPVLTSVHTDLISDIRKYPHKMQNAAIIKEASHYLSELEGTVYICGEGNDVSSELFNRCLLPDLETALPNMISSSIVDMRDGFPSQAFLADYIVVRNPYETNFTEVQQITWQIWNMLLHSDLGRKYYVLDRQYALVQDNAYIEIYKKRGPLHPELIEYVSDQIAEFYDFKEDKKFAYTPNWFLALANYKNSAKVSYYQWDQSMYISGNGNVMDVVFEVDGQFNEMHFSLGNFGEGDLLRIYDDNKIIREEVLSWENSDFEIDISDMKTVRLHISGSGKERFGYHIFNQSMIKK